MKLFQYAVIHHEVVPKNAQDNGVKAVHSIVLPISALLADDHEQAKLQVARLIPETYSARLGELEILIRPFDKAELSTSAYGNSAFKFKFNNVFDNFYDNFYQQQLASNNHLLTTTTTSTAPWWSNRLV